MRRMSYLVLLAVVLASRSAALTERPWNRLDDWPWQRRIIDPPVRLCEGVCMTRVMGKCKLDFVCWSKLPNPTPITR